MSGLVMRSILGRNDIAVSVLSTYPASLARTLRDREDPDMYSSRLYRLGQQLQQVGCTADDYQRKADALWGLSAGYVPRSNQHRDILC